MFEDGAVTEIIQFILSRPKHLSFQNDVVRRIRLECAGEKRRAAVRSLLEGIFAEIEPFARDRPEERSLGHARLTQFACRVAAEGRDFPADLRNRMENVARVLVQSNELLMHDVALSAYAHRRRREKERILKDTLWNLAPFPSLKRRSWKMGERPSQARRGR